eukprot:TRINITY_DN8213_c0_g1_i4.p1 TRINITY_DN8213_c0_g1~~TRINITY_DN8213_c0_g1_i4.p1  ORF type:complete len:210 (-),score=2.41 TRINITY_DN8213_c0_g1_i4:23-652(-)
MGIQLLANVEIIKIRCLKHLGNESIKSVLFELVAMWLQKLLSKFSIAIFSCKKLYSQPYWRDDLFCASWKEQSADQSQFYLDKILLEEQSTSTRENAMFSLLLLEKSEFQEILIITNKFHQLRSYLTFVQAGVDLQLRSNFTIARIAHDIDNSITEGFQGLYVFVRELAAIIYYTAKGYVNHQGFNCILLGLFGAIIIGSVRIYGKSRA